MAVSKATIRTFGFGGVSVLEVDGHLDHLLSIDLNRAAEPLLKQSGAKVVIDLLGAPTIGSMGYVILTGLIETARVNGSRLEFCNLGEFARESLEIMGFPDIDRASVNREDALKRLG